MVVIHSQRTSTEQLRMKRGDEPGANFGKKGQEERWTIGAN